MEPNTAMRTAGACPAAQNTQNTMGLNAGSIILTLEGEMPVEFLNAVDRVITRDSGVAEIKAIIARTIRTDAVSISAGSLGHTRPERDVTVAAGQMLLVRDWRAEALTGAKQALMTAASLVDGEFVTIQHDVELTVYEIEFDAPHVLYVDGLEVSSPVEAKAMRQAA